MSKIAKHLSFLFIAHVFSVNWALAQVGPKGRIDNPEDFNVRRDEMGLSVSRVLKKDSPQAKNLQEFNSLNESQQEVVVLHLLEDQSVFESLTKGQREILEKGFKEKFSEEQRNEMIEWTSIRLKNRGFQKEAEAFKKKMYDEVYYNPGNEVGKKLLGNIPVEEKILTESPQPQNSNSGSSAAPSLSAATPWELTNLSMDGYQCVEKTFKSQMEDKVAALHNSKSKGLLYFSFTSGPGCVVSGTLERAGNEYIFKDNTLRSTRLGKPQVIRFSLNEMLPKFRDYLAVALPFDKGVVAKTNSDSTNSAPLPEASHSKPMSYSDQNPFTGMLGSGSSLQVGSDSKARKGSK